VMVSDETQAFVYHKETLIGTEGMSLRLICKAEYDIKECGHIKAFWCSQQNVSEHCPELFDPQKYLTVVNETLLEGIHLRLRQIDVEIIQLTSADQGNYQCRAECEINGQTANGHFKYITVNGICPYVFLFVYFKHFL
uniref:Immunoglobulin domain-containing protein n=1 Tax=Esox lucius TaxID=8010 RepID=A0A3P8ZN17_ESOLU